MGEKQYKTVRFTGTLCIVTGIISIVTGVTIGVLLLIGGGRLLTSKSKNLF